MVGKRHQLPKTKVMVVKASMCKIQSLKDTGWEGDCIRKKKEGSGAIDAIILGHAYLA